MRLSASAVVSRTAVEMSAMSAAELLEGVQEGVQGCLEGLCGSFSGGAHGFS